MSDPVRPFSRGDSIGRLRDHNTLNALLAGARLARGLGGATTGGGGAAVATVQPNNTVWVKAHTDLSLGSIVRVNGITGFDPADADEVAEAARALAFRTTAPRPTKPFMILTEPADANEAAIAAVSGVALVRISTPGGLVLDFANVIDGDTDKLLTSASGPARVLWSDPSPESESERWAAVLFGYSCCPDAPPPGCTPCDTQTWCMSISGGTGDALQYNGDWVTNHYGTYGGNCTTWLTHIPRDVGFAVGTVAFDGTDATITFAETPGAVPNVRYEAAPFVCGEENVFTQVEEFPDEGWPETITLTPGDCAEDSSGPSGACGEHEAVADSYVLEMFNPNDECPDCEDIGGWLLEYVSGCDWALATTGAPVMCGVFVRVFLRYDAGTWTVWIGETDVLADAWAWWELDDASFLPLGSNTFTLAGSNNSFCEWAATVTVFAL